jgi:hypothetical protein
LQERADDHCLLTPRGIGADCDASSTALNKSFTIVAC